MTSTYISSGGAVNGETNRTTGVDENDMRESCFTIRRKPQVSEVRLM